MSRYTIRWLGIVGSIASIIGVAVYFLPSDRSSTPSQSVYVDGSKNIGVSAGRDVTVTVNPQQPEPSKLKQPPPIPLEEIETVRAQGFVYAAKIRDLPMASSIYAAELKPLAGKLWADPRYGEQAPKESALIFRLYAAILLLMRPSGEDFLGQVKSALPWLSESIKLDERSEPRSKDFPEVQSAQQFFVSLADGKIPEVEASVMLKHQFRLAMPEADEIDVQERVEQTIKVLKELVAPRPETGSVSAKEDFEYLRDYRVPAGFTIGNMMRTLQLHLKGQFPQKNVGGDPIFAPMPNGNTKVMYTFEGNGTLTVEWEVSKAKQLVQPLNKAAESLMWMSGKP